MSNLQTKFKPTIISADGANLGSFNDDFILEDRLKVNSVNPIVKDILISSEDRKFYDFPGINIFSLLKATGEYLAGGELRGGSTIDMQLAKLIKGDTKQTFMRKFQDMYLAAAIEDSFRKKYGEENYKDRILLEYLSWAYFGRGKYGINSACEYFFEKTNCDGITMKEAALLIGVLPYPNSYSANEKIANERGDFILEKILTDKNMIRKYGREFIKQQKEQRIVFSNFEPENPFPFIAEAVRKEAEKLVGKRVYTDGITIHTTINYKMQLAGEEAMRVGFENADKLVMPFQTPFRTVIENGVEKKTPVLVDGALVAINPRNGFVRVYVGGRDWNDSQNPFVEAPMQIGSGIKPPIYGTFVQRGEGDKDSIIIDSPLCIPGKCFRNYDGKFKGRIPLWEALRQSRNIPATKILMKAGIGNVMEKFYLLGVTNQLVPNVQFALGASGVSPREITTAIAALSDGYYYPNTLIEYIEDSQGKIIFDNRNRNAAHKAFSRKASGQMTEMMQRVCLPGGTVRKLCETLETYFGVPLNPDVNPKFDFSKHPLNAAPDAMCKTGTESNSTRVGLICTYSDTDSGEMLTVTDYIGYREKPWPMSGKAKITGGVLSAPIHIKFIEMVATPGNKFKSFKDRREELTSGQYKPSIYGRKAHEEDKLIAFGNQKLEEIAVCGENACGDGLMRKLLELEENDFSQIVNSLGIRIPEPRIKYGSRNDIKRKGLAKILNKFMEMRSSHEVTRELSKIEKIADETLNGYNVYTEVCTVGPEKECSTVIQGYEFSKEIKNISYLKVKDCVKDCIVALKYADSKGKLHTYIKDGDSLKDVNVVNAVIKGGAFATSCLNNGINDAQRIELQNMTPHINYARINKEFSYSVMFSGRKIIAAEIRETDSELEVRKISKVVTIDDRCVNDEGYDCQGKEWPTKKGKIFFYNLYDDVNESNVRGIAQIRAKEGTDATAFGRGTVAFVDREYGTMVINYDGYSVQYDGIFTKLKRGDSVNGSELIGEVDNRNNLFIRAIKGEAPLNLRNQQEVYKAFKKNVADITSILPKAKKLKEANIEAEMQYRLRILEFLTTPFDEGQTTGDISNLARPNFFYAGQPIDSNYRENTREFLKAKEGRRFG